MQENEEIILREKFFQSFEKKNIRICHMGNFGIYVLVLCAVGHGISSCLVSVCYAIKSE